MTFSEFSKLLYPLCGNGETPSNFLIALFGAITSSDSNPLFDKKPDYLKRIYEGKKFLTKKDATFILSNLEKGGFDTYIYDLLSEDALIKLCGNFEPYVGNATTDDITTKIADLFISILEQIAKGTINSIPVTPSSMPPTPLATNLNSLLLTEVSMRCPVCGRLLVRKVHGVSIVDDYHITDIYPSTPTPSQAVSIAMISKPLYKLDSLDNKTILCLTCENDYLNAFTIDAYNALIAKKQKAVAAFDAISRIDKIDIENSLAKIVHKLATIQEPELNNLLRFTALKVNKKILPVNILLKNDIENHVVQFYVYINELFAQESKQNSVLVERLTKAVQFASDELIAKGLSQQLVFDQMTIWLKNKTGADNDLACRILVSFFVQNCEVFNEIS